MSDVFGTLLKTMNLALSKFSVNLSTLIIGIMKGLSMMNSVEVLLIKYLVHLVILREI
jgi:hypothetical protein